MTRINSAIPVHNLTDEHLLAEHREIKRLPYCLQKSINSGTIRNIPDKFTLGKGHVLFFLNKQKFILSRYRQIYEECLRRGFIVTSFEENWKTVPEQFLNDYTPTEEEYRMLTERITDRIRNGKKNNYRYYGSVINKAQAEELLEKNKK